MADPILVARGGVFVPQWGNAARGDSEKITVNYRFLSFEEEERIYAKARKEAGPIPRQEDEDAYEEWFTDYMTAAWILRVRAMVTGIDNLQTTDGESVVEIKTGDELFSQAPLLELSAEIMRELKNLMAVDKKKLP